MGRRLQRLAAEVAKFLAVGGIATLVALVLFNVFVHGFFGDPTGPMNQQPLTAFVVANLLGMVVSYRGSRSWAFRHREVVGPVGGLVAFFAINTMTMAIPLVCLAFSRYVLGLDSAVADNVAANVIGLGFGTAARFWAFRRFVFLSPRRARRQELAS
jgi:putative flippase GtrA